MCVLPTCFCESWARWTWCFLPPVLRYNAHYGGEKWGLSNVDLAPWGKLQAAVNCMLRLEVESSLVTVFEVQISAWLWMNVAILVLDHMLRLQRTSSSASCSSNWPSSSLLSCLHARILWEVCYAVIEEFYNVWSIWFAWFVCFCLTLFDWLACKTATWSISLPKP